MMENAGDNAPISEQNAVRVIRNMSSRTGSQLCACVHCTFGRNLLAKKHDLAGDLADHVFGHLVSTEVARNILTAFIAEGVVQVFEGQLPHDEQISEAPLGPQSEGVRCATEHAFKATTAHDCTRVRPRGDVSDKRPLSTDQEETKEENTYSFRWRMFPKEPSRADALVTFLNEVTDRAFAVARSHLAMTALKLRHRFAVPEEKPHNVRLTYDPDQENIRPPHFLLLPIEAFSGEDTKSVDNKYTNFAAARLVGVSTEDPVDGLDHMQWYTQGMKYAQPWVFYVLAMTFSLDTVIFSRADPSGWEHVALMLWDGRGCIDFIRILLGLALADGVDLGQNPFIVLGFSERTFQLDGLRDNAPSSSASSNTDSQSGDDSSDDSSAAPSSSRHSTPASSRQKTLEKRQYSEMEDDNGEDPQAKKHKAIATA